MSKTPTPQIENNAGRQAARLEYLLRMIAMSSWRTSEDLGLPTTSNIEEIVKAIDEKIERP